MLSMQKITNYTVIYKSTDRGGTSVVISFLLKNINPNLYRINNIFDILPLDMRDTIIIAIQPTACFCLFFNFLLKRVSKHIYILDSHPLGFGSSFKFYIKSVLYYLFAFILFLFKLSSNVIVPNGPISSFFPFNRFNISNWDYFIIPKFKGKHLEDVKVYQFLGTPSIEKGFLKYISFSSKTNLNCYVTGYYPDQKLYSYFTKNMFYKGLISDSVVNPLSDILVWTSSYESYGLVFREFIASGGSVLFLRSFNSFDRIKNAVYVLGKYNSTYEQTFFKIIKNFDQELIFDIKNKNIIEILEKYANK